MALALQCDWGCDLWARWCMSCCDHCKRGVTSCCHLIIVSFISADSVARWKLPRLVPPTSY